MVRISNIFKIILVLGILLASEECSAQRPSGNNLYIPGTPLVYGSDTLPVMHLPEVRIYDVNKFDYLKSRKYRRMIYNVKKAYPYAMIARGRLKALDQRLADLPTNKERRELLKETEKELMLEFENELRRMTVKQGIILVKLIDRETGQTSYEVLQDIKGNFTAFFWQGIAKFFGNDLKLKFDPDGEDKVVEDIIIAIDQGFI